MPLPADLATIGDPDARERVRLAIIKLQARRGKKPTRLQVRKESRANANTVQTLMRRMDAGMLPLDEPWGEIGERAKRGPKARKGLPAVTDPDKAPEWRRKLAEQIATAEDDADRAAVVRELLRLHALGLITANDVSAQQKLLGEARSTAKEIRNLPTVQADRVLLATREGAVILEAFERICGEERRATVAKFTLEQLEADIEENPNYDPVGEL